MKTRYNSSLELKIDAVLENTNWFKLIIDDLGLANSYEDARPYIDEIKEKAPEIKKRWLANPTISFPYVLMSLDILDNSDIKQSKRTNLCRDIDWQYQTVKELYERIPEEKRCYIVTSTGLFGLPTVQKKYVPFEKVNRRNLKGILYKKQVSNTIKRLINDKYQISL